MRATCFFETTRRAWSGWCGLMALVVALASFAGGTALAADDDAAVSVAPKKGEVRAEISKAVLDVTALQQGKTATAGVVLEIKPKYHAQSRTPLDQYLIPFEVKLDPNPALEFGEAVYPAGEIHEYRALGKLSVYTEKAIVRVPIKVKADAPVGPMKITGRLHYQLCDDKTCFEPEDKPFAIEANIVAAGRGGPAPEPANPDVFQEAAARDAKAAASGVITAPGGPSYSLLGGLGLAFLAGIMFNIVPCVLPVLPLKAMGFYEVSQHNRAKSIAFGLVFSLGVVASFATLGLFVVVLKAFTWGELFSNPWFSGVLVLILVVMALNMFGLFTVNLPSGMYGFSPRHDTYLGNFLFGILTAALSTPCTFGLFVSLLAWALTQPPAIGMIVISTVGAGMASPYLVLSAFPGLAKRFPRTGPWPELVKQFMGFLLLAVAVFFAQGWIAKLIGSHNVWWVIYLILLAGGIFLVVRAFHYGKTAVAPTVAIVLALLLVVPTFFVARLLTAKPYNWQPYSATALADARAANKVVLVEFTASWCANCHTLEAVVLNRPTIRAAVQQNGVTMIKADLSDKQAAGWALLKDDLKAEGVPLTVIYSPAMKDPIRLPGLYEVDDLKAAIERAAKDAETAKSAVAQR